MIVVGGGIGGLTTALALSQRGIHCEVHERAPELHEIGAGLGVWPAALAVFDALGIGGDVRALSGPWDDAGIRRSDGHYLVRYTADEFAARLGEPAIGVHRGELQSLLVRALPYGTVRTASACTNVTDHGSHVSVEFADGNTVEAAAVIAADGRRSAIRAAHIDARDLRSYHVMGWRGTTVPVPGTNWHTYAGETWGPGGRFGILPISDDRITWFAVVRRFRSGGGIDEVRERFGTWHTPIPQLVDATPEHQLWRDQLDDLRPLRRWTNGRIALLGDAAHPMTPDLGQGACQAVLDAWVVAQELAHTNHVEDALRAYERRRRRHAVLVTRVARAATVGARPEGRFSVALRSRMASLAPPRLLLGPLAYVTGGPIPTKPAVAPRPLGLAR